MTNDDKRAAIDVLEEVVSEDLGKVLTGYFEAMKDVKPSQEMVESYAACVAPAVLLAIGNSFPFMSAEDLAAPFVDVWAHILQARKPKLRIV